MSLLIKWCFEGKKSRTWAISSVYMRCVIIVQLPSLIPSRHTDFPADWLEFWLRCATTRARASFNDQETGMTMRK